MPLSDDRNKFRVCVLTDGDSSSVMPACSAQPPIVCVATATNSSWGQAWQLDPVGYTSGSGITLARRWRCSTRCPRLFKSQVAGSTTTSPGSTTISSSSSSSS
jgi:hypothetical protein